MNTNVTHPPFTSTYSPNIPELISALNISIAISTYQAGKVVFISAKNKEQLIQLPRSFNAAMGLAIRGKTMAIAMKNQILLLENDPRLAQSYPRNLNTYDALFLPRVTYYTGNVDIHDLHFSNKGLIAVNTAFSCLVKPSKNYSWEVIWKPNFISELAPEDRCHLNGLAMIDNNPRFVSALGKGDTHRSWKKDILNGGVLIDIKSNEIILQDLSMPHSPTWHNGKLYLLLSAKGELVEVDVENHSNKVLKSFNCFVRGLSIHGDYAIIGKSKLRNNTSTFNHLPIAKSSKYGGLIFFHLPTNAIVGELNYLQSVDEIYDVQILENTRRPGILNSTTEMHNMGLSIEETSYWGKLD